MYIFLMWSSFFPHIFEIIFYPWKEIILTLYCIASCIVYLWIPFGQMNRFSFFSLKIMLGWRIVYLTFYISIDEILEWFPRHEINISLNTYLYFCGFTVKSCFLRLYPGAVALWISDSLANICKPPLAIVLCTVFLIVPQPLVLRRTILYVNKALQRD